MTPTWKSMETQTTDGGGGMRIPIHMKTVTLSVGGLVLKKTPCNHVCVIPWSRVSSKPVTQLCVRITTDNKRYTEGRVRRMWRMLFVHQYAFFHLLRLRCSATNKRKWVTSGRLVNRVPFQAIIVPWQVNQDPVLPENAWEPRPRPSTISWILRGSEEQQRQSPHGLKPGERTNVAWADGNLHHRQHHLQQHQSNNYNNCKNSDNNPTQQPQQ